MKLGSVFVMVTEMFPVPFGPQSTSTSGLPLGPIVPPCTSQVYVKPEPKIGAKATIEEFSQTFIHSTGPAVPFPFDPDTEESAGSEKSMIPQSWPQLIVIFRSPSQTIVSPSI